MLLAGSTRYLLYSGIADDVGLRALFVACSHAYDLNFVLHRLLSRMLSTSVHCTTPKSLAQIEERIRFIWCSSWATCSFTAYSCLLSTLTSSLFFVFSTFTAFPIFSQSR